MKLSLENFDIRFFNSPLEKFLGVMFFKKSKIIFIFKQKEGKNVIHTFFCEPLYLYFLDKDFTVIEKTFLKSFRLYITKNKFSYLIESFYDLGLKEGDKIEIDF